MTPAGLEPAEPLARSQFRKLVPYPLGDGAEGAQSSTPDPGAERRCGGGVRSHGG